MFFKTIGLMSALVLVSVPAFASNCSEPIAPAAIDGKTATTAQMNGMHDDVMTFLKQSDDYQLCLIGELKAANAAAVKAKKDPDPALQADTEAKIQANQALKVKVGGEFNASVGDYKKAHP
jgi:hypothetical protein